MRIALCGCPNPKSVLEDFCSMNLRSFLSKSAITEYEDVDSLLFKINGNGSMFDSLILISQSTIQGKEEHVRFLREDGCVFPILTIENCTSENPLVFACIDASDKVLKPAREEILLAFFRASFALEEAGIYIYRKGKVTRRIPHSDILYLESRNHTVIFHLRQEELTLTTSLNKLEEELASERFLRSHQSYLVNLDHVVCTGDELMLDTGKAIPIRRGDKKKASSCFANWLAGSNEPAKITGKGAHRQVWRARGEA